LDPPPHGSDDPSIACCGARGVQILSREAVIARWHDDQVGRFRGAGGPSGRSQGTGGRRQRTSTPDAVFLYLRRIRLASHN